MSTTLDFLKKGSDVETESRSGGGYYFIDPDYLKSQSLDLIATQFVQKVKSRSEAAYVQHKNRMLDYLNHYLNRPRKRKYADQSNIPLPMAQEAVDAHHHAFMNRLARLESFCRVIAPPINSTNEIKQAARLSQAKLQIDDEQMDYWTICDGATLSALIMGTSIGRCSFKEYNQVRPMAGLEGLNVGNLPIRSQLYQGYTVDLVDPIDYYPDPCKVDINDWHPGVTRSFVSFEDLLEARELGAGYFDLDEIEDKRRSVPNYVNDERLQRKSIMGFTSDSSDIQGGIEILECSCWFPIDPTQKAEDELVYMPTEITLANGKLIGMRFNPNRSQSNMMVAGYINKVPGTFWGIGIIEKQHPQIHAGNTVLDLVLENIASTVHRMKAVIESAIVDPTELYSRADGLIRLKAGYGDIRNVLMDIQATPLGSEVFQMLNFFMAGGEKSSFATAVFKGEGQAGVETAQESRDLAGFSSMHNEYFFHKFEKSFIEPSHKYGHDINVDFVDFPIMVQVGGPVSQIWQEVKDSETLNFLLNFESIASTDERNRIVAIQQAMQLAEICKGHPIFETVLPLIMSKIVEQHDWPELEEFKKRLDIGWEQFAMEKKMQLSGGMLGGQPPAPAENAGLLVPGATGGNSAPGTITSRPQNMTRAVNNSDVSKSVARPVNIGLSGKIGRR